MKIKKFTLQQFKDSRHSEDYTAAFNELIAKGNNLRCWNKCVGCWDGDNLMGIILVTVTDKFPRIANIQGLYVFRRYRGNGVEEFLINYTVEKIKKHHVNYIRSSIFSTNTIHFENCGFVILGRQRSGYYFTMCRVSDFSCDLTNPVINKAVFTKNHGGCVEILVEHPTIDIKD